jgi:hypothetical protein
MCPIYNSEQLLSIHTATLLFFAVMATDHDSPTNLSGGSTHEFWLLQSYRMISSL